MHAAVFVKCSDVRVDDEVPGVKVQVVAVQSGQFTPVATGPGRGDDEGADGVADKRGGLGGDANDFFGVAQIFSGCRFAARRPRRRRRRTGLVGMMCSSTASSSIIDMSFTTLETVVGAYSVPSSLIHPVMSRVDSSVSEVLSQRGRMWLRR